MTGRNLVERQSAEATDADHHTEDRAEPGRSWGGAVLTVPRDLRPGLVAAMLLALGGASSYGTPTLFAQDTAPDTVATVPSATPGSNAARLDSLRERAAKLRAEILRLQFEFGVRLDRLESGLVFRVPEAADRDRPGGEALRRVGSLMRRHYPGARLAVGISAADGFTCGSTSEERRTRRLIRRLTGPIGLEASRVVPADCDRLRQALRGDAVDPESGPAVLLLVDRSPGTGGTS